jgi:hypothetical protein
MNAAIRTLLVARFSRDTAATIYGFYLVLLALLALTIVVVAYIALVAALAGFFAARAGDVFVLVTISLPAIVVVLSVAHSFGRWLLSLLRALGKAALASDEHDAEAKS